MGADFDLAYRLAKQMSSERAPGSLDLESRECTFNTRINQVLRAFEFEFTLDAAGGGSTAVRLRVGLDDLPLILQDIAREMHGKKSGEVPGIKTRDPAT